MDTQEQAKVTEQIIFSFVASKLLLGIKYIALMKSLHHHRHHHNQWLYTPSKDLGCLTPEVS
jgi:hypothetical protein